jgi:hypothetical protein
MEKLFSKMLGCSLLALTFVGFILPTRRKRFLGLMNVDTTHGILRVPLTAALLYAATPKVDLKLTRSLLLGTGLFYIVMGTAGLKDKRVGGALPSGLTGFDIVYHFAVGGAAIWLGSRSGRMMKS